MAPLDNDRCSATRLRNYRMVTIEDSEVVQTWASHEALKRATESGHSTHIGAQMEYPRVLYVGGQPIGAQSNSGLTLGAMFGDWPDERLLQIWMEHHPSAPTRGTSHVAEPMTSPFDAALRTTLTALKRARRGFSGAATPETDGMNSSVRRSTPMGARQRARISLQALNDIGPVRLPPSLRQEVSRFDPQVIHSLLGGVRVMRLTLALSRYMDVPIVPHFMDDWVSTLFTDGQLGGLARAQTERVIGQTLARSPLCLTIGADMRSEFQDRLKRRCFVVGNSVDISDYEQPVERRRSSAGLPLVMRYVGGLHLGRDVVVASIAETIERGRRPQPVGAGTLHCRRRPKTGTATIRAVRLGFICWKHRHR